MQFISTLIHPHLYTGNTDDDDDGDDDDGDDDDGDGHDDGDDDDRFLKTGIWVS